MNTQSIEERISVLLKHLNLAIASPLKTFNEISLLDKQGLYLILENNVIIYVGKTTRAGKTRLREMTYDYRSHTLNQKLLNKHFKDTYGRPFDKFTSTSTKAYIEQAIFTSEQFKLGKQSINSYIKTELSLKFYEFESPELTSLEHFAISVLNPEYND